MSAEDPVAPLQLLLVGFETTAGFRGDIARELRDLRMLVDKGFVHEPEAAEEMLTQLDDEPPS